MNFPIEHQAKISGYLCEQYTRINLSELEYQNLNNIMKTVVLNIPHIPKNSCYDNSYRTGVNSTYTTSNIINKIDNSLCGLTDEQWNMLYNWYLLMVNNADLR
jgi:hypothetical protein